jgi:hypothetical protein
MRRHTHISGRNNEQGLIITLVAIFMLGVIGAMAALAIDITTLYTARSEAQLAADSAALAAARVLANSGMTSDPQAATNNRMTNAVKLAVAVATQVAASNPVGGRTLNPTSGSPCSSGEICVNINTGQTNFIANPTVTVTVQRADLPTFFARIWGTTKVAVKATATAEAYNPSNLIGATSQPPVASICVKPMLFPNSPDPTGVAPNVFDPTSGQIAAKTLLGQQVNLTTGPPPTGYWQYIQGDTGSAFIPPASRSVTCSPAASGFTGTPYQLAVAGCVQIPISCNAQNIGTIATVQTGLASATVAAANCLTHASGDKGDGVDPSAPEAPAFEFQAGGDNPLVVSGTLTQGTDVTVSDSLVTVPVFAGNIPPLPAAIPNPVSFVGFAQLFLNSGGTPSADTTLIQATVINLVGCGTAVSGTPIYGNGPGAVPVRLITPSSGGN